MRKLLLVRHSQPEIVPGIPAKQWHLSEEGRLRCTPLIETVAVYQPDAIVTSVEPKAMETAALIASFFGKPFETVEGLHEQDRSGVGFLGTDEFQGRLASFFRNPQEHVLGRESAVEALTRFLLAVQTVLMRHVEGNVIIVTHGTIMTLFVAHYAQVDPLSFWQALGLPDFIVFSLPDYSLLYLPHLSIRH